MNERVTVLKYFHRLLHERCNENDKEGSSACDGMALVAQTPVDSSGAK